MGNKVTAVVLTHKNGTRTVVRLSAIQYVHIGREDGFVCIGPDGEDDRVDGWKVTVGEAEDVAELMLNPGGE